MADLEKRESNEPARGWRDAVRLGATIVTAGVVYPTAAFILISTWMILL